jgi:hypothetical protein
MLSTPHGVMGSFYDRSGEGRTLIIPRGVNCANGKAGAKREKVAARKS